MRETKCLFPSLQNVDDWGKMVSGRVKCDSRKNNWSCRARGHRPAEDCRRKAHESSPAEAHTLPTLTAIPKEEIEHTGEPAGLSDQPINSIDHTSA